MKTIILSLLFMLLTVNSYSQQVYNLDKKKDSTISYVKTLDTAIYHGKTLPVYKSKNNKLFIFVISKKGNTYKKYLN